MLDLATSYGLCAELSRRGKRVLFYPSAGLHPGTLLELPYDVFILVDKGPTGEAAAMERWGRLAANCRFDPAFTASLRYLDPAVVAQVGGKWVFFFPCDNNEVLEFLRSAGVMLSCLLGIQDGCIDGGNYECVNGWQFLEKCFSMTHPDGMDYYLNHSWLLARVNERFGLWNSKPLPNSPEGPYPEFILGRGHMTLCWHSAIGDEQAETRSEINTGEGNEAEAFRRSVDVGHSELIRYRVIPHQPRVYEHHFGRVQLTLEHDNIANHLHQLDGAVVSRRAEKVCKASYNARMNFGSDVSRVAVPCQLERTPGYFHLPHLRRMNSGDSMQYVLQTASKKGWNTVGTTAFGGGEHKRMLEALESWTEERPLHVRIFYLDAPDFTDITTKQEAGNAP